MEKISDIKISHRLFLLVTIPTIFIIALVSNSLYYQSKISIQMSEIEELASFSPTLTNIVHELQKERGASAGFLGAGGQKIFSEKLAAQRVLTDKTRADLDYRLQSINMTSHDKGFSTLLQAALDQLKKLESAREAVSTRKLAVSDMARYYTRTIARLLETVAFMTHLSPDPELAIQIDAYESLLQAKERAGLERAIGSNSFTKGAFAPSIYREFAVLIAEQHVFIDKFKQLSSPEIVTFYEKKMMDPAIARLDAMRDTALNSVFSSPKAITAIKGTLWFDTITKKIDILKEVEAHISAKIITLAEHKSQEATTSLVSIATILFMVLAVTVSLALLIAHSISYPINKISRHMRLMAERDFQGKLNLRESSDEIGNII